MGIVTYNFKKDVINDFMSSLDGGSNYYYLTLGNPKPFTPDPNTPSTRNISVNSSSIDILGGIICGKKIHTNNTRYLMKYTSLWTTNTVYAQYDHTDSGLYEKNFYVLTDEHKVFKCLYNNKGAPSTVKPTQEVSQAFTSAIDCYIWKYMFTVGAANLAQFGVSNSYFPYQANAVNITAANDGIEVIEVMAGGNGYITIANGIVQSVDASNNQIIQIEDTASDNNDYYTRSAFYIAAGNGAGQLSQITGYVHNSSGNFVIVDNGMTGLVPNDSEYDIAPYIKFKGNGTGAQAISTVANGVIQKITIIEPGTGYTRATVELQSNTAFGRNANIVAYVPPIGGHAKNPIQELGSDAIGINITFSNTESGTITTAATVRTAAVIKNPIGRVSNTAWTTNTFSQVLKANVTSMAAGAFTVGETISGEESYSSGVITFANTTTVFLTGDKGFGSGNAALETLSNVGNTNYGTLGTVNDRGDIQPFSPEVLYVTNFAPVARSNTTAETINLVIKV